MDLIKILDLILLINLMKRVDITDGQYVEMMKGCEVIKFDVKLSIDLTDLKEPSFKGIIFLHLNIKTRINQIKLHAHKDLILEDATLFYRNQYNDDGYTCKFRIN